jgi:hypothetical protein
MHQVEGHSDEEEVCPSTLEATIMDESAEEHSSVHGKQFEDESENESENEAQEEEDLSVSAEEDADAEHASQSGEERKGTTATAPFRVRTVKTIGIPEGKPPLSRNRARPSESGRWWSLCLRLVLRVLRVCMYMIYTPMCVCV